MYVFVVFDCMLFVCLCVWCAFGFKCVCVLCGCLVLNCDLTLFSTCVCLSVFGRP